MEPKKHHYVPEAILKEFAGDDGFVYVYDRVNDQYRKGTAGSIGYEKYLYRSEAQDESNQVNLEPEMAKIDDLGIRTIRKIVNKEEVFKDDIESLHLFIAFQNTRVPGYMDDIARVEGEMMKKMMDVLMGDRDRARSFYDSKMSDAPMNFDVFVKLYEKYGKDMDVVIGKNRKLHMMTNMATDMMKYLSRYTKITLAKSNQNFNLVTSDIGLCSFNPHPRGFGAGLGYMGIKGTVVHFPVSTRQVLLLEVGDPGIYSATIDDAFVDNLNKMMATLSKRMIFASNNGELTTLVDGLNIRGKDGFVRMSLY
jgi:hypothetical protein